MGAESWVGGLVRGQCGRCESVGGGLDCVDEGAVGVSGRGAGRSGGLTVGFRGRRRY